MKKLHIIILVFIAIAIAALISFMRGLTTYDTVDSAKEKQGKYVHLIAKFDGREPVEYDAVKNPNHLAFTAVDSLGSTVRVIYDKPKPGNLEISERLVLKGRMRGDHFECEDILMKCPSKYKDDLKAAGNNIQRMQEEGTSGQKADTSQKTTY